jgi:ATP-dependent Clp protease, protease subunit
MKQNIKENRDDCDREIVTLCDEELREIYITGSINSAIYQTVVTAIRHLDQTKGHITLIINTPGGRAEDGFAIAEFIKSTKNLVIGVCVGECMSIGMVILAACDGRVSYPSTRFMVHPIRYGAMPENLGIELLKNRLKELEIGQKIYNEALFRGSSLTLEEINNLCSKERFFGPEEAVGYGFIDEIFKEEVVKPTKKGKKNAKR